MKKESFKVSPTIHDYLIKERRRYKGDGNGHYPRCYLLGADRDNVMIGAWKFKQTFTGCGNMSSITAEMMQDGMLQLLKRETIPHSIVRIGIFNTKNNQYRGNSLSQIANLSGHKGCILSIPVGRKKELYVEKSGRIRCEYVVVEPKERR